MHIVGGTMTIAPYPRDLIGYGGKPPAWKLPNGAKVAVSMVINFEEGAEMSAGDGDPSTGKAGRDRQYHPNGKWDQGTEQVFAYGMRAGIWRMLDWLKRHDRRITFYMCGRAIERAPQIARAIVEAGHEPASHGWLWRPQSDYDSEGRRTGRLRALHRRHARRDRRAGRRASSAAAARAPGRARSCAT
jgi:peptidoglycan/xylan/chitin deacetylase (PgdA/CDA1 family)